eukprot:477932_1
MSNKINLSLLDGIRCLACIWTLILHTYLFTGGSAFPAESECLSYIRDTPILGFVVHATMSVDIFWIISGFLCQYQLEKYFTYTNINNDRHIYKKYICFFVNRLLRLYPLYLLSIYMTYLDPSVIECTCLKDVILSKSIFFMDYSEGTIYYGGGPICVGAAWTINVDVHGYLFLSIIHFIYHYILNKKNKNALIILMWIFFTLATLNSVYASWNNELRAPAGSVVYGGLEIRDPKLVTPFYKFYPEIDVSDPLWIDNRSLIQKWAQNVYFTSINKHGSMMFLGSILALKNMNTTSRDREKNSNKLFFFKLLITFIGFFITTYYNVYNKAFKDYISESIWIGIMDKIFALSVYLCLDVMLAMDTENNMWNKFVFKCLANKIWKFLYKFTCAIYLSHVGVIYVLAFVVNPLVSDVENGGIGCNNYGFSQIFMLSIQVFIATIPVAIIMHYIFEWPIETLRYKYIRSYYSQKMYDQNADKID